MNPPTAEDIDDLYFIFKLTSGDTILCMVIQDTVNSVYVRDPFQIVNQTRVMGEDIKSTTYYQDWFPGASDRVHMIRKDHILSAAIPTAQTIKEHTVLVKRKLNAQKPPTSNTKKDWTGLDFKLDPNKDRFGLN